MAVSVNWGVLKQGAQGLFERGLGFDRHHMALSTDWGSFFWVSL